MERADYESALARLTGAAQLAAAGADEACRAHVFELLAFFRLRQGRAAVTSNDELFSDTATAALTMAGRKEFFAALALLEQARGLIEA